MDYLKLLLGVASLVAVDGYIYQKSIREGEEIEIKNPNYPNDDNLPYGLEYVIRGPTGCSLIMNCPQIRHLGYSNQCFTHLMVRTGDDQSQKVCDSTENFYFRTDTNLIILDLVSGRGGRIAAKCVITAIKTSEVKPPTFYDPSKDFFTQPSWEIDSSEYGGPPGPRKTSCRCGWANKSNKRIVGGKQTAENEFPFMCALRDSFTKQQYCGASIITENMVITAAHCIGKRDASKILVEAGGYNINSKEIGVRQIRAVKKLYQHENYDPVQMKNDIALFVVDKPFQFNDLVGPICLSPKQFSMENQYVTIIGWGREGHNKFPSQYLKKVNLRVAPLAACSRKLYMVDSNARQQICTFGINKSSCMGDSGGPVTYLDKSSNRYVLGGMVSFGVICATSYPAVHTDASAYYGWIQEKIRDASAGSTCY